ncbi:Alpha-glucosidase [uncultured spirochete]|jgi:alpha-galactosidase|uniref:Alpha-glucosidase n=1 Tax=uncultured spirochete TaxID=156406 RepID=A0A3P3XN01_9SPIR|nr:Alpha-glucosidase [uncultured spirochete]
MKLVLIGAGSAQFGFGTLGDIFSSAALRGSHIALVDINGESLGRVLAAAKTFIGAHGLDFSLSAHTDRREALKGADFVIISIEVGNRFELWDQDWMIPLQYGIPQVYGENGGAGGLFHALRIIPAILDICVDCTELCPDATIFNFSNPMTAITTTVLRKFPQLKFIGLCHEIASLERYLPLMLGLPFEQLTLRAAGLNHFSVLVSAQYRDRGTDAYPDILAKAPAFFEKVLGYSDILEYIQTTGNIPRTEGETGMPDIGRTISSRQWSDRRLFRQILERFHLLPITSDSHIGEYIPWAREVADHKGILDFYTLYRASLSMLEPTIELKVKERVIPIIEGMLENSGYEEAAVNIMNAGLIPSLPESVAVEVPARVFRRGVEGIAFPDYPKGFAALLRNYAGVYDLTAEAVLHKSKDLVVQALLVNPVVPVCERVPELVDVMIGRQAQWLGYLR